MSAGNLIVISGASGVGKGTVLRGLMEICENLEFSVSATTRPPRPTENHGEHYYFITEKEFHDMIANDSFLEYDNHAAALYGTPLDQLEEKLSRSNVILDVEPKGAKCVKEKRPDATLIFIMPPSMRELENRLRGRGDTSDEQITMRMERARWEIKQRTWYDHVVVNDKLEDCIADIARIIKNI
jgi:guanylate kinase